MPTPSSLRVLRHAAQRRYPAALGVRLARRYASLQPFDAEREAQLATRFEALTNLADAKLGARVLFATDEWFATAERMLQPEPAHWDPTTFCEQGKVMDGWESRRRRLAGHDWAVVRLGTAGYVHGVEVDTAHFTGNQVPAISIYGACIDGDADDAWLGPTRSTLGVRGTAASDAEIAAAAAAADGVAGGWEELVPLSKLRPGYTDGGHSVHRFVVPPALAHKRLTHLRVNQHPDGGVARVRAWGLVGRRFDTELAAAAVGSVDLASALNGARAVGCSNKHYGEPRNLLLPGRGENMGAGWETSRNPLRPPVIEVDPVTKLVHMPGVRDWAVIRLAAAGEISEIKIDTNHFRGNYPESLMVEACYAPDEPASQLLYDGDSGAGAGVGGSVGGGGGGGCLGVLGRASLRVRIGVLRWGLRVETLMGLVGMVHAAVLTAQIELHAKNHDDLVQKFELFAPLFDFLYLTESTLILWSMGTYGFFSASAYTLDLVVAVTVGCGDLWLWAGGEEERVGRLPIVLLLRSLRLLRLLRLTIARAVFLHFLRLLPAFGGLLGAVFALFTLYAQLGVLMFGGRLNTPAWSKEPSLSDTDPLYVLCNFNDFANALLTLFELLVVNNWHVIMESVVSLTSDYARLYFISWYVLAVTVMFNLVVAHILDGFFETDAAYDPETHQVPDVDQAICNSVSFRGTLTSTQPDPTRASSRATLSNSHPDPTTSTTASCRGPLSNSHPDRTSLGGTLSNSHPDLTGFSSTQTPSNSPFDPAVVRDAPAQRLLVAIPDSPARQEFPAVVVATALERAPSVAPGSDAGACQYASACHDAMGGGAARATRAHRCAGVADSTTWSAVLGRTHSL